MEDMNNDEWRAALNKLAADIRRQEDERLKAIILKIIQEARAAELKIRQEMQRQYQARQAIIDDLKSKIAF